MNDFIMREITEDAGNRIKVTRTRTSSGHRSIKIKVLMGDDPEQAGHWQALTFTSDNLGDDYEQLAMKAAKALDDIACNPCDLPESPK